MNFFTKRKLKKCNPDNIDFFTMEEQTLYARLVDAYDGDSCTLIMPVKKDLKKFKCRLNRIDTAEMRTSDPLEKKYAIKAKERLLEFKDLILTVYVSEADKYGRYLVDLYTKDGTCINDLLVYEGLAYEYYGGTKQEFQEWIKNIPQQEKTLGQCVIQPKRSFFSFFKQKYD